MNQNFVRTLQIGKDTATTALSAGTIPDFDQLVAGDIVVTNPKTGKVITSITGVDEVIVSQKGVDTVYHSAPIRINDIKSSSKKAYAAPVQEKKAIGYNGKAGSFPVKDNTSYSVKVESELKKDSSMRVSKFSARGDAKKYASAKQLRICTDIANNFNINAKQNEVYVYANAITTAAPTVSEGAITAGVVEAGTLTLTKGSDKGVYATNIALETAAIVGNYVGVLDSIDNFIILKIAAVNASTNTVLFTSKYSGTTVTVATSDFATKLRYLTEAGLSTIATNAGIIFTATTTPYLRGYKQYDNVFFSISGGVNTSNEALVTTINAGSFGSGNGYLVADLEEMYRCNFAPNIARSDEFAVITEQANVATNYDVWNITTENINKTDGISFNVAPMEFTVALPATRTSGNTAAAAATILDLIK